MTATIGVEPQSVAAEKLAALTARAKVNDGGGHASLRADPMLIAGAMAGLSELQRELMHAKFMLEYRAHERLVLIFAGQIRRKFDLPPVKAIGVSLAAVHCVVYGTACRACTGSGMMSLRRACPRCEGIGMVPVSDRERAKVAGIDRETFRLKYAEIADNAENILRNAESAALASIRKELNEHVSYQQGKGHQTGIRQVQSTN